ncbi:MAG: glycerophosphodiester phosphodiesterase [Planctomycetota bacterium]|nr:MAG: glycerophosphodiester phosphodiesterase [Planctomycetota bacterium]
MSRYVVSKVFLGITALAIVASAAGAGEKGAGSAAGRVASQSPLIIAHRGDSKVAPENTLPAFASAVQAGADLVELDYLHSSDGVPVVFHDGKLDRTTDACRLWGGTEIPLESKTLAELRQLDAGTWFDSQFAGTRIPTLEEALGTIQNGSMTLIERKQGDPETCVKLLTEKQLLDQVVVQAFDWEFLAGCHKLAPNLVLGTLGGKELTTEKLDDIATTGAGVVGWHDKDTDAATIAAIHDRGWKAWVWTVDDPDRAVELVRAGADGIITNRPAAIRQAVEAALAPK